MKLNENEAIATSRVLLVPYSEHHVETYHKWMEDESLRLATASERLTLPEEQAMQQSWRQDHDKLTFITCLPTSTTSSLSKDDDSPQRMIGDVNLFLYEAEDEDEEISRSLTGELELMIARKDLHHQGYGRAALLAFMQYVLLNWNRIAAEFCTGGNRNGNNVAIPALAYLRARINASNESSIQLFKSIGFVPNGDGPNYFGEVELRWVQTLHDLRRLKWYEEFHQLSYR